MVCSFYDPDLWEISVTPDEQSNNGSHSSPPETLVGNGKMSYRSAMTDHTIGGIGRCIMSIGSDTTAEVFNPFGLKFDSSANFKMQTLNMFNGTLRTQHTIMDGSLDVQCEVYVARHLPYTSVMKVTMTALNTDVDVLDVRHLLRASTHSFDPSTLDYNNNLLHSERVSAGMIHLLMGKGRLRKGSKSDVDVATCCSYMFPSANVNSIGFNRDKSDPHECYHKLRITNLKPNHPISFVILASQMSSEDHANPSEELKRIHLNLATAGEDQEKRVRAAHVKAWLKTWKSNIAVDPKSTADEKERSTLKTLSKTIRYSMYMIWSSIRENTAIEVNALTSATMLDEHDSMIHDGDMFLIPLITLFKPHAARGILLGRHATLEKAMQTASAYGYHGCQYAYQSDRHGYSSDYWDATAPMHLANTAFVSVAIWNYYRSTLDKSFLADKGYAVLKNVADFFVSRVTEEESSGKYILENVMGMSSRLESNNHALTLYMVKAALQCAIEACYELQAVANPNWIEVFHNLDMQMSKPDNKIINDDDGSVLSDYLLTLTPLYSEFLTKMNPTLDIKKVIESNLPPEDKHDTNNTFNLLIRCWLSMTSGNGTVAQTWIDELLNKSHIDPVWGGIKPDTSSSSILNMSAMFLLTLVTGAGTVRFSGNITDTRFYTERMGIKVSPTSSAATMPWSWKSIRINGITEKQASYTIMNETRQF
jgi:hypothetical protein